MRIAQVAPLYESVPPKYYGGTERVVSYLTEELGHTGFTVNDLKDALGAARHVPDLSRKRCREIFEQRFTVKRMAQDYLRVYKRLIERETQQAA
jgi:hypothetical protein